MSYFTQRHGLRPPIEKTETISVEMYSLIFECCDRYLMNIAWLFPEQCQDGYGICVIDGQSLNYHLKFDIPSLFRDNSENVSVPSKRDEYDPFALLDYIEFISQNLKHYTQNGYHSFFGHHHLSYNENPIENNELFSEFRQEINSIFSKTGLQYTLTNGRVIERIIEYGVADEEVVQDIQQIDEEGVKDLLNEALRLHRLPNPANRANAVEKIWDALERLKTYYTDLDKRKSSEKIVNNISSGNPDLIKVFDTEFKALTAIGNNFRIRHHETDKIEITDQKHYDYFFNRCLSLIATAIQYLQ